MKEKSATTTMEKKQNKLTRSETNQSMCFVICTLQPTKLRRWAIFGSNWGIRTDSQVLVVGLVVSWYGTSLLREKIGRECSQRKVSHEFEWQRCKIAHIQLPELSNAQWTLVNWWFHADPVAIFNELACGRPSRKHQIQPYRVKIWRLSFCFVFGCYLLPSVFSFN